MALPTLSGFTSGQQAGSLSTFTVDPTDNVVSGGVATGDWIIAVFGSSSNLATSNVPTPPAGWTTISSFINVESGNLTFGAWAQQRAAGESTYTWTQTTGMGNQCGYRLVFVRGASDVSNWTVGSFDFRANTGTTTTNVAASVTTTATDSLALVISQERTTAAEVDAQISCSNSTKTYFDNVIDYTLTIAKKDMPTIGSTGSVTITYPNTQANNGIAGILGIPPETNPADLMWVT